MEHKSAIIDELERGYQVLNERLFGGKLRPIKVMIHPKKKVSIRYFPENRVLVVGSEFPSLEFCDFPVVLLHEMIHVMHHQNGVTDCTANQYHNKVFLNAALDVGLVVIKHKTQGWAITTTLYPRNVIEKEYVSKPSKDAVHRRHDAFEAINFDKAVFKTGRTDIRQKIKDEKPVKTYFLKYACNCPPPHNSIRSGRRPDGPNALNIRCENCHSTFVCVTELQPEID